MADRVRVAAAQVSGVAAAYAHMKRLSRDQALDEIGQLLAHTPAADRQAVLDRAAVMYCGRVPLEPWYPAAADLLTEAGANVATASQIAEGHGRGGGLGGLGEQAARQGH